MPSSVRFGRAAGASSLSRTTGLPLIGGWTIMAWVRLASDRNTFGTFFEVLGTADSLDVGVGNDGTTLAIFTPTLEKDGTGLTVGRWYHLAFTGDGANWVAYLDGAQNITTPAEILPALVTQLTFFNDFFADWIDGNMSALKVWSRALSVTEIVQEMGSDTAQNRGGLLGEYLVASERDRAAVTIPVHRGSVSRWPDNSGSGIDLAETGTIDTELGAPIPFTPTKFTRRRVIAVNVSVSLTGVSMTAAANAPTVTAGASVTLAGASGTAAAHIPTEAGTANVTLTGASATAAANTPTETGSANVTLTGGSSTATANAPTVQGSASVTLTGASATASAGTLSVTGDESVDLTGASSMTAGAGILTVETSNPSFDTDQSGGFGGGSPEQYPGVPYRAVEFLTKDEEPEATPEPEEVAIAEPEPDEPQDVPRETSPPSELAAKLRALHPPAAPERQTVSLPTVPLKPTSKRRIRADMRVTLKGASMVARPGPLTVAADANTGITGAPMLMRATRLGTLTTSDYSVWRPEQDEQDMEDIAALMALIG